MCGRFTLAASPDAVKEFFGLAETPHWSPRYNIAPTQAAPTVVFNADRNQRGFRLLRWGLIPSWAKDPTIGSRLINARAETAATKPSFRAAFKHRRCLVIADGFYEWQARPDQKRKQPHYIRVNGGEPFAMAGLWEHWSSADGAEIDSCTVLTTEPNDLMAQLHNRMPVILPNDAHDTWLDPSLNDASRLQPLLVPYPSEKMDAQAVNTLVNKPSNDGPACIEPMGPTTLFD